MIIITIFILPLLHLLKNQYCLSTTYVIEISSEILQFLSKGNKGKEIHNKFNKMNKTF